MHTFLQRYRMIIPLFVSFLGLSLLVASPLLLNVPNTFAETNDDPTRKAAEELLIAMRVDDNFARSLERLLEAQIGQNPQFARSRPKVAAFYNKYMGFDSIKSDLITLYAKEFSQEELKELARFYNSPVGQKLISRSPELLSRGSQIGLRRVQDHWDELRTQLREDMKRFDTASAKPALKSKATPTVAESKPAPNGGTTKPAQPGQ